MKVNWNWADGCHWMEGHGRKGVAQQGDWPRCWVVLRKKALLQTRDSKNSECQKFQTCVSVYAHTYACVLLHQLYFTQGYLNYKSSFPISPEENWHTPSHTAVKGRSWAAAPRQVKSELSHVLQSPPLPAAQTWPCPSSTLAAWPLEAFGLAASVLKFHLCSLETETMFFIWKSPAHSLTLDRFSVMFVKGSSDEKDDTSEYWWQCQIPLPGSELLEKVSLDLCASGAHWSWHPIKPGYKKSGIIFFILINQHVIIALTVPSKLLKQ